MSGAVQTAGPVSFDYRWWQVRYPELAQWCSAGQAQGYFDIATLYCDNTGTGSLTPAMCDLWIVLGLAGFPPVSSTIQNIPKRQMLLGLLTAHVAALNAPINGDPPSGLVGRISNASEGSISVAVAYPDVAGAEWYNQTRYGAMFWTATKQYRMAQYHVGPGASFGRWPFGRMIGIALLLMAGPAFAHDMSEPFAEWYQSLTVPGTGSSGGMSPHSCCNGGRGDRDEDCKNVETKTVRDTDGSVHLEAFASSKLFPDSARSPYYGHAPNDWVRVPDEAIIRGRDNPTGDAVGCWFGGRWRCFVEGTQT